MLRVRLNLLLRLLREQPGIYSLKLISLAIGFACAILVISFASKEFTVNGGQPDGDKIFRVLRRNNIPDYDRMRLSDRIPERIQNVLRAFGPDTLFLSRVKVLEHFTAFADDRVLSGYSVHAVEPSIADVFDFEWVHGGIKPHLQQPCALLSATASEKLFGTTDAVGRNFKIATLHDTLTVFLSGIFHDWKNAHEDFNFFLVSADSDITKLGYNSSDFGIYGRVTNSILTDTLTAIITSKASENYISYSFQSLDDIHFGLRVVGESARHGDAYSVWILICISALIILLAITNYANLMTLTLPARSTEFAVSKVAGAQSFTVGWRLVQESMVMCFTALGLGIALLTFSSPLLSTYFSIDVGNWLSNAGWLAASLLLFVFAATLAAPLYPVIVFANAAPRRLLSADVISFPKFKRFITTLQLGVSLSLIVAGLVIERQIDRSLIKEPGRNHEQVVYLRFPKDITRLDEIKLSWQRYNPNIVDVTAASQLPNNLQSRDESGQFHKISIEHDFFSFFGIRLRAGRAFRVNDQDSVMTNTAGVGITLSSKPIGVVENFASKFNQPDSPLEIRQATNYSFLFIRILEVNIRDTMDYLVRFFAMITPNDIKLTFLDRHYVDILQYENTLNGLSRLLTTIGIVMACCAIFALSLSRMNDNLKQIAIRRTFGASQNNIVMLMSREFAEELMAAVLFFGPVTFLLLREWLKNFVYAAHMQWSDPLLGLLACLVIILITNSTLIINLSKNATSRALRR
jgi:putative ABC transport system permease protein